MVRPQDNPQPQPTTDQHIPSPEFLRRVALILSPEMTDTQLATYIPAMLARMADGQTRSWDDRMASLRQIEIALEQRAAS